MKEFSVAMSLFDFIPVLLFGAAAIILQRDFYNRMSKGAFALFAAGTIDVFCAGFLKAVYKLLYSLNVCDFQPLNSLFFPLQSIGFILAGIGIVALLTHSQSEKLYAAAPAVWSGTVLFVALMCIGVALIDGGLSVIAKRMKKGGVIVLFVISFFCCMCMGYLSSRSFDKALFNWIAEFVNLFGQAALLGGTVILHKSGLAEFNFKEEK